jgi:uncharacterized protein (UPF0261 family)
MLTCSGPCSGWSEHKVADRDLLPGTFWVATGNMCAYLKAVAVASCADPLGAHAVFLPQVGWPAGLG